jgi:hypothetical protein
MIEIEALGFSYPDAGFQLRIPEFSIAAGEKVAVIGPSGSGKTTLLNLAAGILVPHEGRVRCAGTGVSALSDAARRDFRISTIGFVFQDFELLDYLNVLDNILHPYRITRALRLTAVVRARAVELAEQMGIGVASPDASSASTAAMEINCGTSSSKYRPFITRSSALPGAPSNNGVDCARESNCRSLSVSNSCSASGRTAISVTQATSVAVRTLLKLRYFQAM